MIPVSHMFNSYHKMNEFSQVNKIPAASAAVAHSNDLTERNLFIE